MKDITKYLVPDLVLNHHGKKYVVPPPSKDDGLLLAIIDAIGVTAVFGQGGDPIENLTDTQKAMFEAAKDRDLGDISLGPVYKEMVDDGVPGPHIDQYAFYAMYYWVRGEEMADAILEQIAGGEGSGPKDQRPSKSGQPTE